MNWKCVKLLGVPGWPNYRRCDKHATRRQHNASLAWPASAKTSLHGRDALRQPMSHSTRRYLQIRLYRRDFRYSLLAFARRSVHSGCLILLPYYNYTHLYLIILTIFYLILYKFINPCKKAKIVKRSHWDIPIMALFETKLIFLYVFGMILE